MDMGPAFEEEYNIQLRKNIEMLRNEEYLYEKTMIEKINNYAIKFNHPIDLVIDKIKNDSMFAERFAIEPQRQNIHEKIAADWLSKRVDSIIDFKNHSSVSKIFVINGVITNKREKNIKSIDFTFKAKEDPSLKFYCSHKYTGEGHGTAQRHQYDEIRGFLENCNKSKDPNIIFLAILDGPYYKKYNFINHLNVEFSSDTVRVLNSSEVDNYVKTLINMRKMIYS